MKEPPDQSLTAKLDITIPEETHTAGKPSVTRVVIHNPHDFPIEIIDIQAPQSSQIRRLLEPRRGETDDKGAATEGGFGKKLAKLFGSISVTEVSFGGIRAEFPRSQRDLNIKAEPKSNVTVEEDLEEFGDVNISAAEEATVFLKGLEKGNQGKADHSSQIVPPRCDKVAYFTIATRGWLFFTPQRINLSTEVRYRVKGQERSQVVTSYFDMKPPLGSMIIGAIVGGGLGAAARILQNQTIPSIQDTAVQTGAAVIMSLIAAIALSRKTGTQGFITVEDFFGAFVIGALIGYGGSEYFERAVLPDGNESPG